MRTKIKYISSKAEKFIPRAHLADTTLSENDGDIYNRPLVFWVRKLSRDEQFKVRELLELKDETDPAKGIKGSGDIAKFIWENCIVRVQNVIVQGDEGVETFDVLEGAAKDALWNTEGMDIEMHEAIMFARMTSQHSEAEAKN